MARTKILLIEDDQVMRENTVELLRLSEYEVAWADNGKAGIEKALSFRPDLILCDIMMPELDGYSVLHLLAKKQETAGIPFIFLSAKSEMSDLRAGMNMGADDYITKPFQDIELLHAIESRLERHENLITKSENHAPPVSADHTADLEDMTFERLMEKYPGQPYTARELLYRENEYGHYVFGVIKGKVKTYKLHEDGKEFITGLFTPGDFFGYKPLLEDRLYQEFAETIVKSHICKIPKDDFLSLLFKHPVISRKFIRLISRNLTGKEEELVQMAYSSVRKRVAAKLKDLIGKENGAYTRISRTDLANMVGTANETLVRVLTEFKELEVIETRGPKIIISNWKKLTELEKTW